MTLPLTNVRVRLVGQDGEPLAGVTVRAELTRAEIHDGHVVPRSVTAETDADGEVLIATFPNALGATGSQTRFRATDAAGRPVLNARATVPESEATVDLIDILTEPLPAIDAAQAALNSVQAAAVDFTAAADAATSAVTLAAAAASGSASAAGTARTGAESARNKAAKWAEEDEDTEVEEEAFSAKHHAIKAAASAEAAGTAGTDAASARDKAAKWAEEGENVAVEEGAFSAKHHAIKSAASAESASGSAGSAVASAGAAAGSASAASGHADAAGTARTGAESARDKAAKWAEEGEDVAVEEGAYSAKHHAIKAAASAESAGQLLASAGLPLIEAGDAGRHLQVKTDESGYELVDRIVLSGPLTARPSPGTAGRQYNAVDANEAGIYFDDGTNWRKLATVDGLDEHESALAWLQSLAAGGATEGVVTVDEPVYLKGQQMGLGYDYVVIAGPVTLDQTAADALWSATEDTHVAVIIVLGNLTVPEGVVLRPSVRKLFTCLYVTGDLVWNGTISMSRRGANHAGTGESGFSERFAPRPIRLLDGTFGEVVNPEIAALGGLGAVAWTEAEVTGNRQGRVGQPIAEGLGTGGGGGAGAANSDTLRNPGGGARGTSFSGGPGGGAGDRYVYDNPDGEEDGGSGGEAPLFTHRYSGAGNPSPGGPTDNFGETGTGGGLFIAALGTLTGSGVGESDGANGAHYTGSSNTVGGGASGGGWIVVACDTNDSSIVVEANAGEGYTSHRAGGDGGLGTALILEGLAA